MTRPSIALFSPLQIGNASARNRIVISPMQQYAAGQGGVANDWHLSHLTKLAVGGAGIVFTEALAVEERGRATHADLGIWNESQVAALRPVSEAIVRHGALAGAQLFHAGRKASAQKPWDGYLSLGSADAARGEEPWPTVGPSAIAAGAGWQPPQALSVDEIRRIRDRYAAAARRVAQAGFQVLNVHAAHGYLIHSFLSPISNRRDDAYGEGLRGRMRFALEVAEAVRSEWPAKSPIFFRLSCIDDLPNGWTIDDTVVLSRELRARGVDVIDCSSRGLAERGTLTPGRSQGFQVPFSEHVRAQVGLPTMAVGLIRDPSYANAVVAMGRADLVAIGREAMFNPHWPLHAALELGHDPDYRLWPPSYGWWLRRRASTTALNSVS